MNLYKLHKDPKSLDHHDKAHEAVPSIVRSRLTTTWADYPSVDAWADEVRKYRKVFAHTAEDATWFASVMQEPFPEAETVIATSAGNSYEYARQVLKGPFKAGEPAIAKVPVVAFEYATNVLKGPFKAGEKGMQDDWKLWTKYLKFLDTLK
jgi:hypothetical protein